MKNPATPRLFYSPGEVARMMGVSHQSVHNEIKRGHIKSKRLGTRHLIPAEEVTQWVADLPDNAA
jgi:excisionase family DNA binding protein